ncbi:hypothetical protein BC828DRAFT_225551 [Blastocladiella britannica]|nr:hypothetical protein BC828DRAFT_225551 [Blastocladiella britannica]
MIPACMFFFSVALYKVRDGSNPLFFHSINTLAEMDANPLPPTGAVLVLVGFVLVAILVSCFKIRSVAATLAISPPRSSRRLSAPTSISSRNLRSPQPAHTRTRRMDSDVNAPPMYTESLRNGKETTVAFTPRGDHQMITIPSPAVLTTALDPDELPIGLAGSSRHR